MLTCNAPEDQTVDNRTAAQAASAVNAAGDFPGGIKALDRLQGQIENLGLGIY
jgi:hypothetical protein